MNSDIWTVSKDTTEKVEGLHSAIKKVSFYMLLFCVLCLIKEPFRCMTLCATLSIPDYKSFQESWRVKTSQV